MPADSVTAIRFPAGVDDSFRKVLASKHNIHVAGGQDELAGKIFRVNHMGYTDNDDALAVVAATAAVLSSFDYPVDAASAMAAARQVAAG
jgi:aspartate aminotransferase-like enzyme